MPRHVITANAGNSAEVKYFLGYQDCGDSFEVIWDFDPWKASWIDALELNTEIILVSMLCPSFFVQSLRLEQIGSSVPNRSR